MIKSFLWLLGCTIVIVILGLLGALVDPNKLTFWTILWGVGEILSTLGWVVSFIFLIIAIVRGGWDE